jgi:uncharacterized protein (TIGR02996 family)
MTHDQAFLESIRAEPDADALRLIYADWLEENGDGPARARGAFIRLQCERAALGRNRERRRDLWRQEQRLLREHWEAWLAPLRRAVADAEGEHWIFQDFHNDAVDHFRRGFVEALTLAARGFLGRAGALFQATPLRELSVTRGGGCAAELAASPHLAELSRLSFVDFYCQPLEPLDVWALARSPHLPRLRVLTLQRNNLGDDGAAALAAAPWLAQLTWLDLTDCGLSGAGVRALIQSPHRPRLERLLLGGNSPGDDAVAALAESPLLASLHTLYLGRCQLGDRAALALAASPHLTRMADLDLERNRFSAEACRALRERFGDRVWL